MYQGFERVRIGNPTLKISLTSIQQELMQATEVSSIERVGCPEGVNSLLLYFVNERVLTCWVHTRRVVGLWHLHYCKIWFLNTKLMGLVGLATPPLYLSLVYVYLVNAID